MQSQVPSLKVWCNFGIGRVWSRNFWMKFPNLCCSEFIALGISLGTTFNQWEYFNHLLSALAAHGQVFGVWSWPQTVTTRCNLAACCCWGGWQSLIPASTSSCFLSLTTPGALPAAGKKKVLSGQGRYASQFLYGRIMKKRPLSGDLHFQESLQAWGCSFAGWSDQSCVSQSWDHTC